ncbi:hypothetical protein B0H13DRAFT_1911624 [Mycena leptocephala]|nr:hypothetical protein B0H13DRAFT_1911624 [Mycena leptocephala]
MFFKSFHGMKPLTWGWNRSYPFIPEGRDRGPTQQARFMLSEMILDSDSEDKTGASQHAYGALEDIMMDGDQFCDADRNEFFFSAGTEKTRDTERQELFEGIRNLDFYDHTVFGKMDQEDLTPGKNEPTIY